MNYFPNAWVFPGGKLEFHIENWSGDEEDVLDTGLQELFEETGIILGNSSIATDRNGSWRDFVENPERMQELRSKFFFAGRRQTPPFDKGVFDTSYFIARGKEFDDLPAQGDGSEIVEIEWIRPLDAISQFERGERIYPPPVLYTFRLINEYGEKFVEKGREQTNLPPGLQTPVEFAPGYFVVPLPANTAPPFKTTNLGIISGKNATLFIDPGWNETCTWVEEILKMYGKGEIHVFLSHHHLDHWAGLHTIEKMFPSAILHLHPLTASEIESSLKMEEVLNSLLDLGERVVQFLSAPGHTSGHMIAHDLRTGIIYGGDHVVGRGTALLDPRTGNMSDYLETLTMLEELRPKMLIPAHGRPNYAPNKMISRYRKHRLEREEQILKLLNKERTVDDILEIVYADVPKNLWKYARYNIVLHLDKLIQDGLAKKIGEVYLFSK